MSKPSRHIPNEIKNEVRKRCGFCCIFCGQLIWEYEHIIPFSEVQQHTADNITLLCRYHHGEVTSGRLSKRNVVKANSAPFGKRQQHFSAYNFLLNPIEIISILGNQIHISKNNFKFVLLRINGHEVFALEIEEGRPLFSISVLNTEGREIIKIVRNELFFAPEEQADINFVGTNLYASGADGTTELRIKLEKSELELKFLKSLCKGYFVTLHNSEMNILGPNCIPNSYSANTAIIDNPKIDRLIFLDVACTPRDYDSTSMNIYTHLAPDLTDKPVSKRLVDIAKGFKYREYPPIPEEIEKLMGSTMPSPEDIRKLISRRKK